MRQKALNKERNQQALAEIKRFFKEERDEELSDFKAQLYLDFILDNVGKYIYEQAIADAHTFMMDKIEDLYLLEYKKQK